MLLDVHRLDNALEAGRPVEQQIPVTERAELSARRDWYDNQSSDPDARKIRHKADVRPLMLKVDQLVPF